ncbi:FliH/SctL family protein [Fibrobacterota bacterium]
MTKLGDNLKDPKGRKFTSVEITRILPSSQKPGVKGYSMSSLPLKVMDAPGRRKKTGANLQKELDDLKEQIKRRNEEMKALQKKAEQEIKIAYDTGLAKGREDGRQEGKASAGSEYNKTLDTLKANLEQTLMAIADEKAGVFLGFEKQAMRLIMTCVRKVFGEIIDKHEGAILPVLKTAIEAMTRVQSIKVKVNPDDFKTADESRHFWLPLSQNIENVEIKEDARIERGSCLVDSESTSVEMKLSAILETMEREIETVLKNKSEKQQEKKSKAEGENPPETN